MTRSIRSWSAEDHITQACRLLEVTQEFYNGGQTVVDRHPNQDKIAAAAVHVAIAEYKRKEELA